MSVLNMKVTEVKGEKIWTFALDGHELYELVCSHVAWTVLKTSGKKPSEVEQMTVGMVQASNNRTMKELEAIKSPFIRAVMMERKRLGIEDFWEEGKDPAKADKWICPLCQGTGKFGKEQAPCLCTVIGKDKKKKEDKDESET